MQKDYPIQNITEQDLDDNNSLKKMLFLIPENSQVVEFGCATGYFSKLLTDKGCKVIGVEINPDAAKGAEEYCENVIVADLDFTTVTEILPNQKFDVAVFGDILEHLRNPWAVLEETRSLLNENGCIVASIPNIAHGAIRLSLLQGEFEYRRLGILDNTHLRFFTKKTIYDLFKKTGYFIDVVDRTKLPIFADSKLIPQVDKQKFSEEIIQNIQQADEADTFQFIVRALPLSLEDRYTALNQEYHELVNQFEKNQTELDQVQTTLNSFKVSKFWQLWSLWTKLKKHLGLVKGI